MICRFPTVRSFILSYPKATIAHMGHCQFEQKVWCVSWSCYLAPFQSWGWRIFFKQVIRLSSGMGLLQELVENFFEIAQHAVRIFSEVPFLMTCRFLVFIPFYFILLYLEPWHFNNTYVYIHLFWILHSEETLTLFGTLKASLNLGT